MEMIERSVRKSVSGEVSIKRILLTTPLVCMNESSFVSFGLSISSSRAFCLLL